MDSTRKNAMTQIKSCIQISEDGELDSYLIKILSSEPCYTIINECRKYRSRLFTPLTTILLFIQQVLSQDKSCRNALAKLIALQFVSKVKECSHNIGAYCQARMRIPESTVTDLVQTTGSLSTKNIPAKWQLFGLDFKLIDGTTVRMADSKENKKQFTQYANQKEGVGFPAARLVVIMSLALGSVLHYAIGPHKGKGSGEHGLLRTLFSYINSGDAFLADRYYPSYFLLDYFISVGANGIFKAQTQRKYDFKKGKRLGPNDHIVEWHRPPKPDWMDQETYDATAPMIQIREFIVAGRIYVTTFLDKEKFSRKAMAAVYQQRWYIELNLRSIKSVMKMKMLSCKTPEMVKKEIGIHFLAYNLIRIIIAEASIQHDAIPNKISFKSAVQVINAFTPYFNNHDNEKNMRMYGDILALIVQNKVGTRPGRIEPRANKDRGSTLPLLKGPRGTEREKIMLQQAKKQAERVSYA